MLVCDGQEYPIREGDGMFIPGNVDHYTLNNRVMSLDSVDEYAQRAHARYTLLMRST